MHNAIAFVAFSTHVQKQKHVKQWTVLFTIVYEPQKLYVYTKNCVTLIGMILFLTACGSLTVVYEIPSINLSRNVHF